MSVQVTNYQCPNCDGALRYVGASGKLECGHCDSKFDVALIEQLYADKEKKAVAAGVEQQWDITQTTNFSAEEAAHMRGYLCPSCAAEMICDDTTAATSCHYCGNPAVVPGQFSEQLRPDYVLPFKLDKKSAVEALKKYYKGKRFLPKAFAEDNHIDEIKGVYVPFWLFDAESEADMLFRGTRVRVYTTGDYQITETDHYRVKREGNITFEKVPVDAFSKMPDAHMDSIEPFDYGGLAAFSMAYLPGYLADKYDRDAGACSKRANERIRASTETMFRGTATGYATLRAEYSHIHLKKGDVKYALLPVWLLSTQWNGKNFLFAMNGQSGKLIGDLPVDWGKFFAWFAGLSLPLMGILAAVLFGGAI